MNEDVKECRKVKLDTWYSRHSLRESKLSGINDVPMTLVDDTSSYHSAYWNLAGYHPSWRKKSTFSVFNMDLEQTDRLWKSQSHLITRSWGPRRPTPLGNAFASGPFALGRCLRSRLENRGDKMVKLRKSDPVYHKDTSWYKFYITSHIQCSNFQWQEENLPYSTQVNHSDVRVLPLRHKCLAIMGLCVRWSKKYIWFMVIPSLGTPSDGCINPC